MRSFEMKEPIDFAETDVVDRKWLTDVYEILDNMVESTAQRVNYNKQVFYFDCFIKYGSGPDSEYEF